MFDRSNDLASYNASFSRITAFIPIYLNILINFSGDWDGYCLLIVVVGDAHAKMRFGTIHEQSRLLSSINLSFDTHLC